MRPTGLLWPLLSLVVVVVHGHGVAEEPTPFEMMASSVEAMSPVELQSCAKWLDGRSARLPWLSKATCPVADDKELVRGKRVEFVNASYAHVPKDAVEMCRVIQGLFDEGLLVEKRGILADVGAAFAGETVVGHLLGFGVTAFEVRPDEVDRINAVVGHLRDVRVVNAACTDTQGKTVTLYKAEDSSSLEPTAVATPKELQKATREKVKQIDVPAVTLDSFFDDDDKAATSSTKTTTTRQHGTRKVAFIKIDAQGHEYNILKGALHIILRDKPALYFEYAPYLLDADTAPRVICLIKHLPNYHCSSSLGHMIFCFHNERRRKGTSENLRGAASSGRPWRFGLLGGGGGHHHSPPLQ